MNNVCHVDNLFYVQYKRWHQQILVWLDNNWNNLI